MTSRPANKLPFAFSTGPTRAQNEPLDLLAPVAEELCCHMELEEGDIQILNNHVTYHSRTGYEDHDDPARKRLLFRVWLSTPDNRPLPKAEGVIWGSTEAGAIRGGVIPAQGPRFAFPDWNAAWGPGERAKSA